MTLSRLELGFESPWGRHQTSTRATPLNVENCRESPKVKGSRFFVAVSACLEPECAVVIEVLTV